MSPRPYKMGKRQAARTETRGRILEAARQLLAAEPSSDLSLEAIAQRADVSRLTIYYQFSSRAGLLEALYDHLAQRGHMEQMADVFQASDPMSAIEKLVHTFVGFWATDPRVMRRLRGIAALDPEVAQGIRSRDARRPRIALEILKRAPSMTRGKRGEVDQRAAAEVLGMLTGFETYDALARAGQTKAQIEATLTRLARCAIGGVSEPK